MGYKIMIYEKRASLFRDALLGTNPNFNTNAPPFEVRGCKVILGGAFLGKGGANYFLSRIFLRIFLRMDSFA